MDSQGPLLTGDPDPNYTCPEYLEAATNSEDDHESVYEAQVAANSNEGFNGKDGLPLCCACGGEASEHVFRVLCEVCKQPIKHPRPGSKKHVHLECRDVTYWNHCVGRPWRNEKS